MPGVIIILGGSNDNRGNLSVNTVLRIELALDVFSQNPEYKILVTGGYGEHFNCTNRPHYYYILKHLEKRRVRKRDLLLPVMSNSTIEDARNSKNILYMYGATNIILITSKFHMLRAKIIFRREYGNFNIRGIGAVSVGTLQERIGRQLHEFRSILKLIRNAGNLGLFFSRKNTNKTYLNLEKNEEILEN